MLGPSDQQSGALPTMVSHAWIHIREPNSSCDANNALELFSIVAILHKMLEMLARFPSCLPFVPIHRPEISVLHGSWSFICSVKINLFLDHPCIWFFPDSIVVSGSSLCQPTLDWWDKNKLMIKTFDDSIRNETEIFLVMCLSTFNHVDPNPKS